MTPYSVYAHHNDTGSKVKVGREGYIEERGCSVSVNMGILCPRCWSLAGVCLCVGVLNGPLVNTALAPLEAQLVDDGSSHCVLYVLEYSFMFVFVVSSRDYNLHSNTLQDIHVQRYTLSVE